MSHPPKSRQVRSPSDADRPDYVLDGAGVFLAAFVLLFALAASQTGPSECDQPPCGLASPLAWLVIGLLGILSGLLLFAAFYPRIRWQEGGLVLLRRHPFGRFRIRERIPLDTIRQIRTLAVERPGREPLVVVRIDLADGRRFRVPRSRFDDETYSILSKAAAQLQARP